MQHRTVFARFQQVVFGSRAHDLRTVPEEKNQITFHFEIAAPHPEADTYNRTVEHQCSRPADVPITLQSLPVKGPESRF